MDYGLWSNKPITSQPMRIDWSVNTLSVESHYRDHTLQSLRNALGSVACGLMFVCSQCQHMVTVILRSCFNARVSHTCARTHARLQHTYVCYTYVHNQLKLHKHNTFQFYWPGQVGVRSRDHYHLSYTYILMCLTHSTSTQIRVYVLYLPTLC